MAETILEMAKDLVMAHIESGQLSLNDMQEALRDTYASLMELQASERMGSSTTATPETVDWRKSIARNTVTCLECGQRFKQLSGRHLRQHGLNPRSYRVKYGIPRTQPLSGRAVTARRRELAREIRPWEKTPRVLQAKEEQAAVAKKGTRTQRTTPTTRK
jgi:predicted transcriptional regulator